MTIIRFPPGCLLGALLLACADRKAPEWAGRIDTLPSGTIVVVNPAAPLWDSADSWTLAEELVIGAEVDSVDLLSQITSLEVDSENRVYVLERSLPALLVYDPTGRLIHRIGREGDGPGEFREPNGLGLDAEGRVWVVEGRQQRWSAFDEEGRHLTTKPRPIGSFAYYWFGKFLNNGDLIDQVPDRADPGKTRPLLARYDSLKGEMVDTLVLPYVMTGENNFRLDHGDAGYTVMGIPYYPASWSWIDPRGFVWVGNTGRYELVQLNMDGDTVRVIRKEHTPIPVTDAERDSVIQHVRTIAQGASFDEGRIPRAKPAIERMVVDDSGYVYVIPVREVGAAGTMFDVFDPEGRYLGQVATPRRIGPWRAAAPLVVRRGRMWAVVVDEDDVPGVVGWRVGR